MVDPFWVTFLLGSSVLLGTTNASASSGKFHSHSRHAREHHQAEHHHTCPKGWKTKPFLCFDESQGEYDFESGLIYCLNQQSLDEWTGQFYGLISVGQLRHFKNRYPYADAVDRNHHHFADQRIFRVNARKVADGSWKEYFTGKDVQLHHYPGFNAKSGRIGDTLIWDSKTDKLYTADPRETFHVLCSTRRSDTCKECPDAQWENECNNAGDCLDGICHCDIGFEGHKCQVEPIEDANVDLIVYAGAVDTNPSQKYSLETNVSCAIANFPADVENLVGGQAFGHPLACGGNTIGGSAINQCWIYRHQTWLPEVGMLEPRSGASGTVINDGRHDMIYWVTFGEDDQGNDLSSTEYLSWYGESWKTGPSLDPSYARKDHCTVQINKCEAAVLGGVSNDTAFRDDILIFNFEDAKWKLGPRLQADRAFLTCAVIKDSVSGHPIVISACGIDEDGPLDVVEKWDLVTWDTEILPFACPSDVNYFDSAWAISDHEIILTTGSSSTSGSGGHSGIWSFTLDYGFRKVDEWSTEKIGAGSALISKDYVQCV